MKQNVLVILGPTASGKSDLAVRLAKKLDGEIISADSRQVYKGLNIGTGKITKKEMGGIPHHLLDIVSPNKQFSVAQYKELAKETIKYIIQKDKLPIIVGGTGLYIDSLTGVISFPDVKPNKALRERLEKKSAEQLFQILRKKDPKRARTIDPHNKIRLIRALEIIHILGHVPLSSPGDDRVGRQFKFTFIGLKPDNLDERIYERLVKRLEPMIREARKLKKSKILSYKRMHQLGLEYRYIAMYLQKKVNKKEMVDKLYIEIKHYAKRQMTWFSAKGAAPTGTGGQGSASPEGGKRREKIKWFTLSSLSRGKSREVRRLQPNEYKQIERYARIALSGSPRIESLGD